jgi:hypothetical protein
MMRGGGAGALAVLLCLLAPGGEAGPADVAAPPVKRLEGKPNGARPVRPVEARRPDAARLKKARARFSGPESAGFLGPYALYTDLQDPARRQFLDRLAAQMEDAYRNRYGRQLLGQPAEAIVLYAREQDYLAFQDQDSRLARLSASGHSGYGIVALYDEGRTRFEVGSTLVHELAHLLNRRALGPLLPSWLDEGIADDLAQSKVDDESGRLVPGTLGGMTVRAGARIQMYGPRAALQQLVVGLEEGKTLPLPQLLALDWDDFVRTEGNLNYAHSSFWVRYLLDGEGGALAPRFRSYLDAVAAGKPPTPELLRLKLERSWGDLESGFRIWVLSQREDRPRLAPTAPAATAGGS